MHDAIRFYDRLTSRLSRRDLMKLAWFLGAAAVAPPLATRRAYGKPIFDAYPFPLGVASGDPLPDGVVLWTRLAPKPFEDGGMTPEPVMVNWRVASDEKMSNILRKGTVIATSEAAHSVHVDVRGLEPARW